MMLWYKAWKETQTRFLVSAGFLALFCMAIVVFHSAIGAQQHLPPGFVSRSYSEQIYKFVYSGTAKGLFAVFIVPFLGLGGLLRERTASFTLALPVSRFRLVAVPVAVGMLEMAAVCLVPALVLPVASLFVHESYPVTQALHFSVLWFGCCSAIFATAFFFSTVAKGEYIAPLATIITFMVYDTVVSFSSVMSYQLKIPWIMAGYGIEGPSSSLQIVLSNPIPWVKLLGFSLAAVCVLAVSLRITQRHDF
jgi:ABC-2 type transport system permease protein